MSLDCVFAFSLFPTTSKAHAPCFDVSRLTKLKGTANGDVCSRITNIRGRGKRESVEMGVGM